MNVREQTSNEAGTVVHQACDLAKRGRECAENIHGWIEPLGESLVVALTFIQFIGYLLKYGEDSFGRRIAAIYLSSEWVGSQVFTGLLPILFQGFFEHWLKIWRRTFLEAGLETGRG